MKRRTAPEDKRGGFSLIELLVVIGIVGLLAGLLLPALLGAKARAQRLQCISNEHQLGLALHAFLGDYHSYPLGHATTNSDPPGVWWFGQLARGGFGGPNPEATVPVVGAWRGVWRCPSGLPWQETIYGYNMFGSAKIGSTMTNELGLFGHNYWHSPNNETYTPVREAEVVMPADMIAIGESSGATFMRHVDYDFRFGIPHKTRVNVLFCDGHVQSPKVQFLFEDISDAALVRWNRDHQPHRDSL